jgi:MFS family permease
MVPLGMFRSRGFAVANVVSFVMAFGVFGAVFVGAQFLQTVQGYSPLEAGVRTLPWTAAPALIAPISGILAERIGARWVLALSLAMQGAGIGLLAAVARPDVPYSHLIAPFVIAGVGMGLFFAPIARVTLGFAPRGFEGVASGTANTLRQLGTVLGIAVLGVLFSAFGGYDSGQHYVDGMRVAQVVGAIILAAGALVAVALPALTDASPAASPAAPASPVDDPAAASAAAPATASASASA